jgi:glutamine cyclotransferase
VTSVFNASGLLSKADVLNGIACYLARDIFFIPGKLWPKLFEVRPLQ